MDAESLKFTTYFRDIIHNKYKNVSIRGILISTDFYYWYLFFDECFDLAIIKVIACLHLMILISERLISNVY